ncbi:MAG: efflux transporter outer membrane subunit [Aquabacterium sp.]
MTRLLTPLMAALVLAGCATAPTPPQAQIDVPAAFKEAAALQGSWKAAEPAESQPRGEWWLAFNDPALTDLQQQAAVANPSLAAAAARVKAARALLTASRSGLFPQVNLNAGVTRQKTSPALQGLAADASVPPATVWQAGIGASYEIDLFGRVANGIDAAQSDLQATEAGYRSVLLALQADVAQAYYLLRTLDAEVAVLAGTQDLRQQTLQLIERRRAAGDVSELDVSRARTDLATTRAELQGLQGQRQRAEHALAVLLGRAPAAYSFEARPLPADVQVPQVPAGLPSALLERRPDVAAAQARMMAATSRVGQARSALFPALVLTGQRGQASYELSDLFHWDARTWLASAVMSLPLFDGGRNRAAITSAEASLEASVADYRQSVLNAFGDVEGQLSSLGAVRAQSESLAEAVVAARRAAELADKRYRAGEDSYLTLIDTQRSLLAIERQAVQLRGAWASSTVGLIRALGGGWGAPADRTAASAPQAGSDAPANKLALLTTPTQPSSPSSPESPSR